MFDKINLRGWFGRPRKPDPVVAEATRVFEQHSARLFDQVTTLIESRMAEAAGSEPTGVPGYADFVRARRQSLLQKLASDVQLQELREQTEQAEARQELARRLSAAEPLPEPDQTLLPQEE